MNISHFSTPDTSVKSVLVYLNGVYPPKNSFYVEKDLNLPARLYPNAKIYIRCRSGNSEFKNYQFFRKIYQGRNITIVPDDKIYEHASVDVIWFIHYNFIFFGGKIDDYMFAKQMVLQNFKGNVHILFNEEMTKEFEPLYDYVQRRNDNFKKNNQQMVEQLKEKKDWSNVTLIANQDKFSQWVNDRPVDRIKDTINISYLSDKILYDLPDMMSLKPTVSKEFYNGIYVGKFNPSRLKFWNTYMGGSSLSIATFGPDSDKLKYFTGTGKPLSNTEAKDLYSSANYAYSIYFGKGTPSAYLGATFYEPILLGKPLFIWTGTDPEKKLFPNLDCYFSNAVELEKKLSELFPDDLVALWDAQRTEISKW